jgi:hypothetical protein
MKRSAIREVPPVRDLRDVDLETLTPELEYGPVFSRSVGVPTTYRLQFFRVSFGTEPKSLLSGTSKRSKNVLVPQRRLFGPQAAPVSGLVHFLNGQLPTGIEGLAPSWGLSLSTEAVDGTTGVGQLEIPL